MTWLQESWDIGTLILTAAIFEFSLPVRSSSLKNSIIGKLDSENIGVAVACLEAEKTLGSQNNGGPIVPNLGHKYSFGTRVLINLKAPCCITCHTIHATLVLLFYAWRVDCSASRVSLSQAANDLQPSLWPNDRARWAVGDGNNRTADQLTGELALNLKRLLV